MKCWVCDGLGVTYKSRRSAFPKETCTRCNGTGEIQTNEEWFDSLPTKEKAKVLSNIAYSSAESSLNILHLPREVEVMKWEQWLREVHRE